MGCVFPEEMSQQELPRCAPWTASDGGWAPIAAIIGQPEGQPCCASCVLVQQLDKAAAGAASSANPATTAPNLKTILINSFQYGTTSAALHPCDYGHIG